MLRCSIFVTGRCEFPLVVVQIAVMGEQPETNHVPVPNTGEEPARLLEPQDQETMHVHKVKPAHGWKEFANEIVIIVLGVLIALGLEQVVETIHWNEKAEQATVAMRGELRLNYQTAAEQIIASPCIDRQLQLLENNLSSEGP